MESESRQISSPDADFRRAFPLDSRSVWIEQQNVHGVLFARDNFPLGPGEYSPTKMQRHISTPSLAPRDHFQLFSAGGGRRTGGNSLSGTLPNNGTGGFGHTHPHNRTASRSTETSTVLQDVEYRTMFHDHHSRNPLDYKNRHTATPGPFMTHSNPSVGSITNDGKYTIKGHTFGPNDIPFGERVPSRLALEDYNVNDEYYRRKPILGCIQKERRFKNTFGTNVEKVLPRTYRADDKPWRECRTSDMFLKHRQFADECEEMSVASLAKGRTKLDHAPEKLRIDTSAYKKNKNSRPNGCIFKKLKSVDPASIDKQIKRHPFANLLTLQRSHHAIEVGSKVAEVLVKYK